MPQAHFKTLLSNILLPKGEKEEGGESWWRSPYMEKRKRMDKCRLFFLCYFLYCHVKFSLIKISLKKTNEQKPESYKATRTRQGKLETICVMSERNHRYVEKKYC